MSLTKLQTTLIDVYERIIMHGQVFDPDQETLNFLLQAGMTPESETNQRYLQLVRTLRHEDYNVRSSAAKFLCMILFKNHNLQCRIRSLLPITILAANLLVFNLPVFYNTSVLTDLQKDMKDDTNPNRNMIFWHFPVHHMQTESLPSLETLEPAVEEMLLLKLDPLYQFVGSLTAGRKLISRQAKMKPGLLERKLTAHFSSPSLNPVKNPIERSKSFRLKPTLVTEKSGIEDASPNQKDPDFFTLGSRSYRSGSKCSSPKSNRSLDKISRKEVRSVTITTDRSMDNSPTRGNNMPVMNHKTPKFSEVKDFWMPKGHPGQGVSNQRRRIQKGVSKKSFNTSKNVSQTDTNTTSPVVKEKISLLDILERNPDYVKEVKMRLSKSRMDLQELSDSPNNRSMTSINRGRARSLTNPRSDRSISKDFSADYMRAEQSDMSRETLRLLKQDRHDMYRDYDKQVERMRLRPFDKKKFESTCFDPNNFPQKIAMPVVDRKKAFVDFLNAGGKVTEKPVSVPGKIEGIKGNTFHGRKWKNHTSKARLSNFAEKEKYVLYLSPTSAKVQADMKMRYPPKEKPELEVIKDHLATDVAGSQQKYITNIMEVEDLDNKVYGESFKKYLDVLNYEKANYNANDPSKLGEAYDLVNIIYDAKEKAVRRHKAPAKTLTTESEEGDEEEIDDSKPKRKHKDPRFAINVPRSGLFLRRRRSSMASSNAGSDYNSYHHPHSDHHNGNGKGKKPMHSNMHSNEEIVRLPTGNSTSLHAEILTLHPFSRGKSLGSSQVKTE